MSVSFETAKPKVVAQDKEAQHNAFVEDVRAGLTSNPKRLSPRYFYDAKGSQLFEAICDLPEYYLTRAEFEILRRRSDEIAATFKEPISLVELGSGSSVKTRLLIEAALHRHGELRYVPIDISRSILEESVESLISDYDDLDIHAIVGEYAEGLRQLANETGRAKLILFLGSNIGNLEPDEATDFLRRMRSCMGENDRALVGTDLRKDRATLEAAYDDSAGVTAQFNLNVLERINRELDADFDLDAFAHRAFYNEAAGRVEMHLVSERAQTVHIAEADVTVEFAEGETIHSENSHKYDLEQLDSLAAAAGFAVVRQWFDVRRRFCLNLFAMAAR